MALDGGEVNAGNVVHYLPVGLYSTTPARRSVRGPPSSCPVVCSSPGGTMSTKRAPSHLDPAQRDVVWSALCAIINEQLTVGR